MTESRLAAAGPQRRDSLSRGDSHGGRTRVGRTARLRRPDSERPDSDGQTRAARLGQPDSDGQTRTARLGWPDSERPDSDGQTRAARLGQPDTDGQTRTTGPGRQTVLWLSGQVRSGWPLWLACDRRRPTWTRLGCQDSDGILGGQTHWQTARLKRQEISRHPRTSRVKHPDSIGQTNLGRPSQVRTDRRKRGRTDGWTGC